MADRFPITIKAGSFQASIYRKERLLRGKPYVSYRLSYYAADGRRVLRDFGDLDQAKAAAREVAAAGQAGRIEAVDFTAGDRALLDQLNTLAASVNTTPLPALESYVAAVRRLPVGTPLGEVVDFYLRRHPAGMPKVTVSAAIESLNQQLEVKGLSEAYLRKLRIYLRRFGDAFGTIFINELYPPDVSRWLTGLPKLGARSIHNYHEGVVTLAVHAQGKRWIGRDLVDELSKLSKNDLPKLKLAKKEIGIFTPGQIQRLLDAAPDDIRASVAVGAFAGLRSEEIHRIQWSAFNLADRTIEVEEGVAKTNSRRSVPIADNLAEWLLPLWRRGEAVDPSPTSRAMIHRWVRLGQRVGVPWKHNALRHSFVSYRLAVTQDLAQVALEAGNSPSMIQRHYNKPKAEMYGREWFAVRPAADDANIIPLMKTG